MRSLEVAFLRSFFFGFLATVQPSVSDGNLSAAKINLPVPCLSTVFVTTHTCNIRLMTEGVT